jgi:hypothetical protein
VEVKNGYVSICKEAILGNCSTNECKSIIFVLKNFNGKSFLLIITKLGIRTLMPLLQPLLLQKIIHINHRFFSSSFYIFLQIRTYVRLCPLFLIIHKHTCLSFIIRTHILKKNMYLYLLSLCFYVYDLKIFLFFVDMFVFVMKSFTVSTHKIFSYVYEEKSAVNTFLSVFLCLFIIIFFFFYFLEQTRIICFSSSKSIRLILYSLKRVKKIIRENSKIY